MDARRFVTCLLALVCAGCGGGRLMQLTSPAGANGKLYVLSEVPRDVWPKPPSAQTPLYVSGTLKLAPNVTQDGSFLSWLGSRVTKAQGVGRIELTFFIDPKRAYTTTILMDETGTAVALQRDDDGNIESTSLLAEKSGKTAAGAPGVPLWLPKWVDRYVYVNVSITQLPPEASGPFKEAVSAFSDAGASMLPEVAATPLKSFAERFASKDDKKNGGKPMSIDLTLRRLSDCRSGRDCSTALADQTLVFLEKTENESDFIKRYSLSGVELVDKAGKPYPGVAAFIELHVDRLPDTLFSANCRALLADPGNVDADDLEKACSADELAPSDKLAFEPLRDAIAAMRQPFADREHKAKAFAELDKRAKLCGPGADNWPADSAVCAAALGLIERTRQRDVTLAAVGEALRRYGEALKPLDNVDLKGPDPCGAFAMHDARERAAEDALKDSPAVKDSGCLFSHEGEPPVRCKDLPSLEETAAKYRERRQKLAEACALDRLAKADLSGHPDRELARQFILEASTLQDIDWAVMKPRADQPVGTEPPEKVAEALRGAMDPAHALPPSQRLNQLLERARRKLESLTLDYAAALRSYQAFTTSIDIDSIKALAQEVEHLAAKRGERAQWLRDLLRDAALIARLSLGDLFEGSKDSYKVLGNWEDLRGKSTQVRTLLRAALQELSPPTIPVEPGASPKAAAISPMSAAGETHPVPVGASK